MSENPPTRRHRLLTPEDVLEVLREHLRQQAANGEACDDVGLTPETTIDDWHLALLSDDWPISGVARFLNYLFSIDRPLDEWRGVLEPYRKKTLGPVCEYIARHATVPVIEPITILGRSCRDAGAFFVLREAWTEAGANVTELRPSTSMSDFLCENFTPCWAPIVRLGAGKIPAIKVHECSFAVACRWFLWLSMIASFVSGIAAFACDIVWGTLGLCIAIPVLIVSYGFSFLAVKMKPDRVAFGELRQVRDLCRVLAR